MDRLTSRDRHDFAQVISGVARRWRTPPDERLKPMNMSIARWGALYWLGMAGDGVSQAALAELAGGEPPTPVRGVGQPGGPGPGGAPVEPHRPPREPAAPDRGGQARGRPDRGRGRAPPGRAARRHLL